MSEDDWEKKLAAVKIYKEDMNKLVMNFLVTEVDLRLSTGMSLAMRPKQHKHNETSTMND